MSAGRLFDPTLDAAAALIDDLEQVRISAGNRVGILLRSEPDGDGLMRGFGLTDSHPAVATLLGLGDGLEALEHQAVLALQRAMRAHPLGGWVKATVGVGEKQAARLLHAIGDPYWHTVLDRPRTVSELWAYCGLHVLPVGQSSSDNHTLAADGADSPGRQTRIDTQISHASGTMLPVGHECSETQGVLADGAKSLPGASVVTTPIHGPRPGANLPAAHRSRAPQMWFGGGNQDSGTGQAIPDAQPRNVGVAPARRKGAQVNWSTDAKTRAYLVAESCMKNRRSPYRPVYDNGRAKYLDALHATPCARCGPKGRPAKAGSPLSAGHQHARAMRLVMKEILKDLWLAARECYDAKDIAA